MPLVRRTPLLPPVAVKKMPKRCVLLCVGKGPAGGGAFSGGSDSVNTSVSGSRHGTGGRGLRVRAIRIAPELW